MLHVAPRSPTTTSRAEGVRLVVHDVLAANWQEGVTSDGRRYAYTFPAAPRYRHQWHWDSCLHAIAWSHLDPLRAREELRTVLRSGRADGFLPHTAFWHAPLRWRRAPLYAVHGLVRSHATASIGPPLLAMAWERVAAASADEPEFATEALHALEAHHDWLARARDPDGDGLLTILLPDESGLDDAPKFDVVFGRLAHHLPGYFWLCERSRRLAYDGPAIIARYSEHVEEVLVNVAYALSGFALGRLRGEGEDGEYTRRARMTQTALLERCLDPDTGLFFDLAGPEETPVRVSTWASLAPLALPELPEDVARRTIEEHVLDPRRYRAPCGIPSVSMEEPSFRPSWDYFRTWRGPSWAVTAWLIVPALRRWGYEEDAERIVAGLLAAVERDGLREYYHPLSGAGLGAKRFGMSALLLDLAAEHETMAGWTKVGRPSAPPVSPSSRG